MKIRNQTTSELDYELKGGPLRMTLSTCLLMPGEEEVWQSPYTFNVDCELHVTIGDKVLVRQVGQRAVVSVVDGAEGPELVIAG